LNLANRVYVRDNLKVKPEFVNRLKTSFNSTFGSLGRNAKDDINKWVESVTNNKIKDLMDDVDSSVRMVLVSAIYFKAEWEDTFSEGGTKPKTFFASGKNTVQVPMMHLFDDDAGYATFPNLDATALLKSYVGGSIRMIVVLPNKKDGLPELEKKLTKDVFAGSNYASSGSVEVEISLPKFKIEDSFKLNDALKKLAVNAAFSDSADFSGIAAEPLKIDEVVHKSFIDLNEKGTEAAAATGIKAAASSFTIFPESAKKVFNADHPFIFAIQHVATESVLFIGRYAGPSSA